MAFGNRIVITDSPRGRYVEGTIGASFTPKPGTAVEVDYSIATVGGRFTWKVWSGGADGARSNSECIILREDILQGRDVTTAYAAGERAFGYVPAAGNELNLLLLDVAGTADDHTKGENLIIKNASGKFIATTGSPLAEPAVLMETITDPVADTLAWCTWKGED